VNPAHRTIAVTGASGFLGQYFCKSLAARGHRVIAFTSQATTSVAHAVVRVTAYTNVGGLEAAMTTERADAVIHLAGRAHVRKEVGSDPESEYRAANADATEAVCRAARAAGLRHAIVMSSAAVVGDDPLGVVASDTPVRPTTPYGRSKLEGEQRAADVLAGSGVRLRVFRPPLVYGPGMRGNPLRLFQLVDSGMLLPLGGIRNRRSFVAAGNLLDAILASLGSDAPSSVPLYVSDSSPVSTTEFVRAIGRALKRRVRLLPVGSGLRTAAKLVEGLERFVRLPVRSDDLRRLTGDFVIDASPLRVSFGWTASISLDDGLQEAADWWRAR
jgi:nucleoside-diphosphate-sugar epimerase